MPSLLRTKLFLPTKPDDIISRPHLIEQLNAGKSGKLSLVVAPAGYGKSTLVSAWIHLLKEHDPSLRASWLSLDHGDNEFKRFFQYFVTALAQHEPLLKEQFDRYIIESALEKSIEDLLIDLINETAALSQSFLLVLDDLHEIENPDILNALSFWLDHQPPNVHLAATSRTEPQLQLPRLRVRQQLTEIGVDSMRFSREETADFLNRHVEHQVEASAIERLDQMTEGWIASLQLAAISLKKSQNPTEFIDAFQGNNRLIVDYLMNEVLNRQPADVKDFLLQTAILDRFNEPLCRAVTQNEASGQMLERLFRDRLFLVPLDDAGHWYRYHHLFSTYLQSELHKNSLFDSSQLHKRASHALQEQGLLAEAIDHAFAGKHIDLAAKLIGINAQTLITRQGDAKDVWQWVQKLPETMVSQSPELLIASSWIQLELYSNISNEMDEWLNNAEMLLQAKQNDYDKNDFERMHLEIALIRNNLARNRGKTDEMLAQALKAADLVQGQDSYILKMTTKGALTITYYASGDISQFIRSAKEQLSLVDQTISVSYANFVLSAYLIDGLLINGKLAEAEQLYSQLEPHISHNKGNGPAILRMSWAAVLYERNQFDEAIQAITDSVNVLRPLPSMRAIIQSGSITLAKLYFAQGKTADAIELLNDVQHYFDEEDLVAPLARVEATAALLQLKMQNIEAAREWADQQRLKPQDKPSYAIEIDHLVLARLLIAEQQHKQGLDLLIKLEQIAKAGGRVSRQITILILQALIYLTSGEQDLALEQIKSALGLGRLGGFIRTFLDEGPELIPLLENAAAQRIESNYALDLLTVLKGERPRHVPQPQLQTPSALKLNALTERETLTLQYLATDLTIPEIADQMVVAPSTIRTYVKRLYSKLDVHTRIEAVNRGRALNILN